MTDKSSARLKELWLKEHAKYDDKVNVLSSEFPDEVFTYHMVRSACKRLPEYLELMSKKLDDLSDEEAVQYDEEFEIIDNGELYKSKRVLLMSQAETKDKNYMLKAHGFDPDEFQVTNVKVKKWNVYSKVDGVQQLYSTMLSVKPIDGITMVDVKEIHEELVHEYKLPNINLNFKKNKKLGEFNIADPHIGKFAWSGDTGENYDHKIAQRRYMSQLEDFIEKTKHVDFERIIYPFSHDLLHVDTPQNTTTYGTPQDVDARTRKIYKIGKEMLIKTADALYLENKCPIEFIWLEDNHSMQSTFHLACDMESWYRNEEHITVDTTTMNAMSMGRKYYKYGKCALLMLHGTKMNDKKIAELMAKEQAKLFGDTIYREAHPAHLHKDGGGIFEDNGVTVRRLPSISGTDKWHYDNAFVGSLKRSKHFVWDKETGVEQIIITPVLK